MAMKKSPLHQLHEKSGAHFEDIGGFDVPMMFSSVEQEYTALRKQVGIVDLSHKARFRVNGSGRLGFLDHALTSNISGQAPRSVSTSFLCNEKGGVIDRITVFKDEQYILLSGSPENRPRVHQWLTQQAEQHPEFPVEIIDVGTSQGQLELVGPNAQMLLETVSGGMAEVREYRSELTQVGTARCLVSRRKFSGLDGFIITAGSVYLPTLYETFLQAGRAHGVRPVGERAIEMLRIEAGLAGVGRELTEDVTPIEVGAVTLIDYNKVFFNGRLGIIHSMAAEFQRRMVMLKVIGQQAPPERADICLGMMPSGSSTSSILSPQLRCGVACTCATRWSRWKPK